MLLVMMEVMTVGIAYLDSPTKVLYPMEGIFLDDKQVLQKKLYMVTLLSFS